MPSCSSRAASTPLAGDGGGWCRARGGGERDREPARGVDAGAVDAGELAQLVEARDRIPRVSLDEALGKVTEPGFPAAP